MRILSVTVYFLGLIFSSFMMFLLVLCLLIEFMALRHLIFDGLHFLNIIQFTSQDLIGSEILDSFLLRVSSGKYSFMYYAFQGTMIFIGINVLVYITGVWKIFVKIVDGYSNYKIINPQDPIRQKLSAALAEIHNNASTKLNITLPDYNKFDFEIQDDNENIGFHITPTQVLRPTKKVLTYLQSHNKQDNDLFKAVLAHEIGHFVNKDTEINQFKIGIGMVSLLIRSTFHKLSPRKWRDMAFMAGGGMLDGGCFGLILAFPLLMIALFLWLAMLPGIICLWFDEKFNYYVITPLINLTSRGQEYRADAFATKLGYGQGLLDLFDALDKFYGNNAGGFSWQRFFQDSHPTNYARTKNIVHLMNKMGNP